MTTRTMVKRIYVPSVGQSDAADRATALAAILAPADLINDSRYGSRVTQVPSVVLDFGYELVVVPEPTTHAAVDVAQDAVLDQQVPATVARVGTDLVNAIAAHAVAVNPHSITPGTIGAASSSHSHVDGDLPAGLARDAEVAAAYALIHSHPYAATSHAHLDADIPAAIARDAEVAAAYATLAHNHDAAYATAAHNHDAAYAALAHSHAVPSGGAIRKTANQTMTATAQTAVTDMAFAVAANATYYFVMSLRVTTSTGTAPTTAWGFTGPAGVSAVAITAEQDTSTSIEAKGQLTAFGALAAGAQVANTGAEFRGIVQTGGTAGTVQLTCARAGTTPSMVVALGSNGFWLRLA